MRSKTRRDFFRATGAATASLLPAVPAIAAESRKAEGRTLPMSTFSKLIHVRFSLNGKPIAAQLEPRVSLLDFLRERTLNTGTKKGCNEGACGACTVLVDGKRINACLTLAVSCDGAAVVTIEGLARPDGTLHPVQAAFIEHDALQCGYCTPGQVVSAVACIREGHARDAATVREWMSGNICRCAAYPQITAAVLTAGRTGNA